MIYTGEQRWIHPRRLIDRMFVPECIRDKINDWNGYIMDIKDNDVTKLKCKDNRQLVEAVQRLYRWNKDIHSISDMLLTKEVAIVVSTIIGEKELVGYIEKQEEGEEINMCTAIREFREEGMRLGKKEGMMIILRMLLNQKFAHISEDVMEKINQSNEEQLQLIISNLNNLHTEKDILKFVI